LIVAGPGTAIDDVLNLLGVQNIAADAPTPYPRFSLEEVIRRAPDIIFMVRTHDGRGNRTGRLLSKLKTLEAVRQGRLFHIGDPLLRMGPRITEGIAELAGHLQEK
jgi:iron complex transport system substrate-binding protein